MDSFADGAAKLAGLAGVMFGWRPGEFWEATQAELGFLIAALRGDGGELDGNDVEQLRQMLRDSPSTIAFRDGPPPQAKLGED